VTEILTSGFVLLLETCGFKVRRQGLILLMDTDRS